MKRNSQGFIQIIIILVVLAAIAGAYYFGTKNKQNVVSEVLTTGPIVSTWKTYTNTKYNFELKYPTNWYYAENNDFGVFISNKPITKVSGMYTPELDQIVVEYLFFASAFENGLGITEYKTSEGIQMVSDTKFIAPSQSFGASVDYQKSNPNLDNLLPITDQILSTVKFTK
ncbi:MAG TPA: hypothetical protein VL401_02235 [Alphaproteobacteria bacterium]|jgi:hypothetical protein|nr:hypothetical protein [Alphaproteobacteria bacterium]